MRNFDLSPLSRSTIGFDRMMQLFENAARFVEDAESSYPPYDIEKTGEDSYRITMAVAGFALEDLTLTQQANSLIIAGRRDANEAAQYLHRALIARPFERRFDLADYIMVTGAQLANGLLSIDLVREIPEAKKPRSISIETGHTAASNPAVGHSAESRAA